VEIVRRRFLRQLAAAGALSAAPRPAWALDYPNRPVRVIVGFAPGGPADLVVRLINQWLSDRLGQQFILENRPGAGTNVATEAVLKSAPDGYTLLLATTASTINASLYNNLDFVFLRDIAPVASIDRQPLVLEVNPALPAATVTEFIAYAKANPGKINYGTGGVGTIQHVAGELFKYQTGVDLVHVPYRGGAPVLTDLMAGRVQAAFSPISASIPYIQAGKLRALAVTSATRLDVLPNTPALNEFLPGYEVYAANGIGAPAGTPAEIIARLNTEINAGLADPTIKARLADLGSFPSPMSSADYAKYIAAETEKWAKVVKFANIKVE
jgi:tripartite-type tricarboxylate transporter receptor subunit TctC